MTNPHTTAAAEALRATPSAVDPARRIGTVCELGRVYAGQCLVQGLLGEGGQAEVYLVEHQILKSRLALKVLKPTSRIQPDLVTRFRAESRALWELKHPNFVQVHAAGDDPEIGPYMLMELLEGNTLRHLLELRARLPIEIALPLVIAIAETAQAMHDAGIIHRDLKPENVFVTLSAAHGGKRGVKILDLGAAKIAKYGQPETAVSKPVGTGKYMSPEHIRSLPLSHRSDVYSLGLITFEVLAGCSPFGHDHPGVPTPIEYKMWQCNAEPPLLDVFVPGCPRDVAVVVSQALRKNPDERFASMTAFAAALRSAYQSHLAAKARGGTAKLEVGGPMTESDLDAILCSPGSEGSWSNLIANARHTTSGAVLAKATTGTGTHMMEGTEDKLEVVAHLVMQIGPSPGHRYALTRGTYVVGRDRDVDLYINDPSLSAHHAKIVVHPTGIVEVTDESSTNGTFVDDVRVPFAVPKHGARLRFGTVSLDVAYVDKLRRLSAVEGTVRVESSSGASGVVPVVRPALATRESPVARSPAGGVPVTQSLEPVHAPVHATVPMPVKGAGPGITAPAYLSGAPHIPAPPVVSSSDRQKQSTVVAIIVGCSVGVLVITLVYFLLQSGRL